VVILRDLESKNTQRLLGKLKQSFLPEVSWLAAWGPEELKEVAPFAASLRPGAGTSVHICQDFACSQPETDLEKAMERILG